jgi:hypothetical protein
LIAAAGLFAVVLLAFVYSLVALAIARAALPQTARQITPTRAPFPTSTVIASETRQLPNASTVTPMAPAEATPTPIPTIAATASPVPPTPAVRPQLTVDRPADRDRVGGVVTIGGWAIDRAAPGGTGVDVVQVWLDGAQGMGTALGPVTEFDRPDVAALVGARFLPSGWTVHWDSASVAPGPHTLFIYARSAVSGEWAEIVRSIAVSKVAG